MKGTLRIIVTKMLFAFLFVQRYFGAVLVLFFHSLRHHCSCWHAAPYNFYDLGLDHTERYIPLSKCICDCTRNTAHAAVHAVAQCLIEPCVQTLTVVAAAYEACAKGMPRFAKKRCAERSTTTISSSGDRKCLSQAVSTKSEIDVMIMIYKCVQDTFVFVQNQVQVSVCGDSSSWNAALTVLCVRSICTVFVKSA